MGGENEIMGENIIRKLLKKENMVLLILGGLLLVVITLPVKKTETTETETSGFYLETAEETYVDEYSAFLEKQLEEMLSKVNGVGEVEVMITLRTITEKEKILYPEVEGVLVSCQGAGTGSVNADITQALEALFGLDAHKIKVLSMKGSS